MSWAKFDDQYPDHPKIMRVGPLGMALHMAATCYCARYLTDGFVPSAMINKLVNFDGITVNSNAVTNKTVTDELTAAGLFEVVEGGFMVHDYLKYNPPAEQVKAERAANADRQADWRKNHRDDKGKFASNGVSNGVTTTPVTSAPSPYPYPSLPNGSNKNNKVVVVEPPAKLPEEPPQRPNIYSIYEREIGPITPMLAQELDVVDSEYPPGWFVDAVKEARLSSTRLSLNYVTAILKRWKAEGRKNGHTPTVSSAPQKIMVDFGDGILEERTV